MACCAARDIGPFDFSSYSAIPIAIWIFIYRRPHVEMRGLAAMFAAFILWCGLTHMIDVITLWYPIYELQGWVKAVTAAISVTTAWTIFPLIPYALAIPSPNELKLVNENLAAEVVAHRKTLQQLQRARDELEQRVTDRTRELAEVSERFRLLFEHAPVAMLMVDRQGDIRQANSAARTLFGSANDPLTGCIEAFLPESARAAHATLRADFARAPVARLMGWGRDLHARKKSGADIPVEIGLNPIDVDGQPFVVASVIDISERKQRETQIRVLMQEVNHRSKNMLGVVQAIVRYTAAQSPGDFVTQFSDRVAALGVSQDLLIAGDWTGVDIADLVKMQLAHFQDLIGRRVRLSGERLRLATAAAQTIGMALHELATNAVKYGALSNADGTVESHGSAPPPLKASGSRCDGRRAVAQAWKLRAIAASGRPCSPRWRNWDCRLT